MKRGEIANPKGFISSSKSLQTMSTNNKKRPLSEISDDSTPSNKKRKVMIDDDDNKEMEGLDAAEPEEQSKLKNELMYSGEPITLNVGGLKYETSLHTLTKYRDSVLSKMFEGKFSLKPTKDGSYFIDRDGTFFGMILNYLRTGQIIIPQTDRQYVISHLLMESQYYQISSLEPELRIMSIDSNMVSPQQIAEIQAMIYPKHPKERKGFNWKLLYKYNYIDNICGLIENRIIHGRKSVLMLMKTDFSDLGNFAIWAIFVGSKFKKRRQHSFCPFVEYYSISEGFAFKLNSSEKIEINEFRMNNHYNESRRYRVGISIESNNPVFRFTDAKPIAFEIYQL
eukprot:155141_1